MPAAPRFRRYTPEVRAAMLVEAGLACLAQGGITAFTIDNICRTAGASRGLITHHFGSKDGLLAAVYTAAYQPMLASLEPQTTLPGLIAQSFAPANFNRQSLNVWLALWGEVATNPALQAAHRSHYARYRSAIATAIATLAEQRGLSLDAYELALSYIALVDGLWLEQCLAPDLLNADRAKAALIRLLEPVLGPLPLPQE